MSEFTVPVVKVLSVSPIVGADSIEVVQVLGYRCVVKIGTFAVGDLAVYIPEAAIVPEAVLETLGLVGMLAGSNKNRVKAVKLRGVVSQGILLPCSVERNGDILIEYPANSLTKVGDQADLAGQLGITKYEPIIPVHMAGEVCNLFGHTLKYDIENIQRHPDIIKEGEQVVMTEKLHGCVHPSTLIMLPNGEELPISTILDDNSITQVLSYDVITETFKTKTITGKLRRPNAEHKRWVQVTLENGRQLRITEDHPIFSNDRNDYIEAKNILPGEDIKSPI